MAYSKTKPYNKTSYKGAADPSYDRYLKEAVNAGKAENVKESELEKPYNVKQTYGAMQQNYNPTLPPVIDPGPGTGGLKCLWTSTGCEQLVGCWAGSDIVLDGPEAATAGYMPTEVLTGEVVSQVISGSEGRAIELILNPAMPRNTFNVKFKDGLGIVHTQVIDIVCAIRLTLMYSLISEIYYSSYVGISNGITSVVGVGSSGVTYKTFDGSTWSSETVIDSSTASGHGYFANDTYKAVAIITVDIDYNDISVYLDSGAGFVLYGTYDHGSGAFNGAITIVVDSTGKPHMIVQFYLSGTGSKILHIYDSGGFTVEDVVDFGLDTYSVELLNSVFIDSLDNIHLAYIHKNSDESVHKLYYITGTTGSWGAPELIKDLSGIAYSSGSLGMNGNSPILTIGYSGTVKYYYKSGIWQEQDTALESLILSRICKVGGYIFITGYVNISFESYYRAYYFNGATWLNYYSETNSTDDILGGGLNFGGNSLYNSVTNEVYRVDVISSTNYMAIHTL